MTALDLVNYFLSVKKFRGSTSYLIGQFERSLEHESIQDVVRLSIKRMTENGHLDSNQIVKFVYIHGYMYH